MTVSDPIADMCTRLRNATVRSHQVVKVPFSKIKQGITKVLEEEGFIESWTLDKTESFPNLVISLKYNTDGESVIRTIRRVSKPGRRVYSGVSEIIPVLNGQGVSIVTTSKGILSDRECHQQRVGGEVLCQVW